MFPAYAGVLLSRRSCTLSLRSVSRVCGGDPEFIVINSDGIIRTFFRQKDGKAYWNEELNSNK